MSENIKVILNRSDLVDVANTIRNKTGSNSQMTFSEFTTNISGITGVELPSLDNPATNAEVFEGYEVIDGKGQKQTGTFTIDSELATQKSLIPQIRNALRGKALPPGSASNPTAPKKDVNFYDYDGTRLYSYTVEEAQALTELPPLPSQPGLICQEWNFDLATIKSYNRAIDVGATYITDDGKTRLYIRIAAEGRMDVPLYFSQTVSKGVTIDWGDGSATQKLSGTGDVNTTHAYASIGDYVITLDVADGCTLEIKRSTTINAITRVYNNMYQKVEIGKNIRSLDLLAFSGYYSLTNIIIPNSVQSIGNQAFSGCRSLTSVIIPNSVTSIGDYAFYKCSSLASVIIPNSVTSIGNYVFNECSSLASVVIPNRVISIGSNAFSYCYSLASIVFPSNVTSIGSSEFHSCFSLASVVIPNRVTSIVNGAFSGCESLASIVIPNRVTSINPTAFSGCTGMAIYDFTSHTSVPTLVSTNAFTNIPSDCIIKVPAALYDEWIAATNWSTYASQIIAV